MEGNKDQPDRPVIVVDGQPLAAITPLNIVDDLSASSPSVGAPPSLQEKYNTLAKVSVILLAIFPLASPVLGVMALKEINRTGERGKFLAKISIGVSLAWILINVVFYFVVVRYIVF
ncbi:MAG: hypothetical protein JWO35_130 [Candidatus Saccharibacteria bacterium]|nr:hypothetical protein [Candidatus Saccharibacteria bacterium]